MSALHRCALGPGSAAPVPVPAAFRIRVPTCRRSSAAGTSSCPDGAKERAHERNCEHSDDVRERDSHQHDDEQKPGDDPASTTPTVEAVVRPKPSSQAATPTTTSTTRAGSTPGKPEVLDEAVPRLRAVVTRVDRANRQEEGGGNQQPLRERRPEESPSRARWLVHGVITWRVVVRWRNGRGSTNSIGPAVRTHQSSRQQRCSQAMPGH
jgi:hypothetical protein